MNVNKSPRRKLLSALKTVSRWLLINDARSRKAVALNFDAKIEHIINFDQTLLARARQLGWCENGRVDPARLHRAQSVAGRAGNDQRHVLVRLKIEFLKQDQRRVVRRRTKAADTEPFAFELLDLIDAGPSHHRIVVRRFRTRRSSTTSCPCRPACTTVPILTIGGSPATSAWVAICPPRKNMISASRPCLRNKPASLATQM